MVAKAAYQRLWPLALVPAEDLVGRGPAISKMYSELATGRSVILAAPRRVGKSSVAQEVVRRLQNDGWIGVHIDFLRYTSTLEVADELARQVLSQSHSLADRLSRAVEVGKQIARVIKPHWDIAGAEFGIDLSDRRNEPDALRKTLQLPQQIATREGRQVVLFLDEFQEAAASLGSRIYGVMRSYFQAQPDVHQIFAGSRAGLLRQLFSKPNAPLLRYATEVPLPPIAASDWMPYIVGKFAQAKLSCTPAIAESIVQHTGGHPADTMEVCQQLYLLALAARVGDIDSQLLRTAVREAQLRLHNVFDEMWAELATPAYSRLVASRIARGEPPTAGAGRGTAIDGTPAKLLVGALKGLANKGIVEKAPNGGYRFAEPFLQQYVLERDA